MTIQKNYNVRSLNTFRISALSNYFAEVFSVEDLGKLISSTEFKTTENRLILGGGSNTLFTKDFDGIVILNSILGKEIVEETDDYILIKVGGGEDWHEFVTWAVNNQYAGVENLALIPGTLGAAPVQNIAAYGQNLVDVFHSLEAFNLQTGEIEQFNEERCKFQYRSSVFKQEFKGMYFITTVTLRLEKEVKKLALDYHERKARYGSLEDSLKEVGAVEPYSIKNVYDAVINIRKKKLPSVEEYGTCGSFFKNPVVTKSKFQELTKKISELQSYPVENLQYSIKNWEDVKDDYVKIPAARLIDELGWRDKWIQNVASYKNHALCIVTNGKASGGDVLSYINLIKNDVMKHYGVELESEVNII